MVEGTFLPLVHSPSCNTCEPGPVLRAVTEDLNPVVLKLRTVCRCNNIKHGTIEIAIRAGACTVDEVGRRTTATTGQCGGSCTPEVVEMIETYGPAPVKNLAAEDEDAWWAR